MTVIVSGISSKPFFRNGVCCALLPAADGWAWLPFLGVEPNHVHAGDRYVVPPRPLPPLHRIASCPIRAAIDTLQKKVWYTFEPARPLHGPATLEQLKDMADWFSCAGGLGSVSW